jgi:hypothetical protein
VLAYAAIFDAQHDSYAAAQRCLAAEQVRVVRLCCFCELFYRWGGF